MENIYYIRKILKSPLFKNSERMKELLSYLYHNSISENQKDIKEITLAIDVFGEDSSFDPSTNGYIRVAVYKLRKKLGAYYSSDGKNDIVKFSIPKGKYTLLFTDTSKKPVIDSALYNTSIKKKLDVISLYYSFQNESYLAEDCINENRSVLFSECLINYLISYSYIDIFKKNIDCDYALTLNSFESEKCLLFYMNLENLHTGKLLWSHSLQYQSGDYIDWIEVNACTIALELESSLGILIRDAIFCPHRSSISIITEFLRHLYSMTSYDLEYSIQNLNIQCNIHPNNAELLGALSYLYAVSYTCDTSKGNDYLLRSYEMSSKSLFIDSDCPIGHISMMRNQLVNGEILGVNERTQRVINSRGNFSCLTLIAAYHNSIATGKWNQGASIYHNINRVIKNPPRFLHLYFFLYEMHKENYRGALMESYKMPFSDYPIFKYLKVVLLMKLGKIEDAIILFDQNEILYPRFLNNLDRYLTILKNDSILYKSIEVELNKVFILQ